MLDANINVPQDAVYGVDRKPDAHVFFQWVMNEDTGKMCGHYDLLIPRDTASEMIPNDSDDTIQWLQPTVPFHDGLSDEAMLCHELPIEFRFDINSKEQTTQAVAETAQQSTQPPDTAHASTEAHQEQHTEQDKTNKQTTAYNERTISATEHTEANQHAAAATKKDQQQEHSSDEKDERSHDTTAIAAKPPTIQQDDLQPPLPEPMNMPDPQQEKADEQTPPINTHITSATEHAEAATKMDQQQEHSSDEKDKESHDTTAIAAKPPTIQQDDLQPPLPEPKNMPDPPQDKADEQTPPINTHTTSATEHAEAATKMDQQQEHSSDEKDKESHDTTAIAAKPPTIQQDDLQPPLPEPKNMPDPPQDKADEQTPPINTHTTSEREHAEAATKKDQQQEHSSDEKDKESHDTTAIAAKPPTIQQDDLQPPLPEPKNMPDPPQDKADEQTPPINTHTTSATEHAEASQLAEAGTEDTTKQSTQTKHAPTAKACTDASDHEKELHAVKVSSEVFNTICKMIGGKSSWLFGWKPNLKKAGKICFVESGQHRVLGICNITACYRVQSFAELRIAECFQHAHQLQRSVWRARAFALHSSYSTVQYCTYSSFVC